MSTRIRAAAWRARNLPNGASNWSVAVLNANPTGTTSVYLNTVPQGTSDTVLFTSATDPSPVDLSKGLHFAFDFNGGTAFNTGEGDGTYNGSASVPSSVTVPASYLSTLGNHNITCRVIDKDGGYTDYTETIDVIAASTPLAVSTFTPTASGFDVQFNRSVNPSLVHLYDGMNTAGTSN